MAAARRHWAASERLGRRLVAGKGWQEQKAAAARRADPTTAFAVKPGFIWSVGVNDLSATIRNRRTPIRRSCAPYWRAFCVSTTLQF